MRWPFGKRDAPATEQRAAPYGVTLEYINAKRHSLLSDGAVSLSATVGIAAHYWQSAFAMLDALPEPLPSDTLAQIGLDLLFRGQSVWHIRAENSDLDLVRAAYWDEVSGGCVLHIPHVDRTETVRALSGEVLNLRINASPIAPWRGRSPFELMGLSPTLLAEIEAAMSGAMPMAGKGILPMPANIAPEESSKALSALRGGSLATVKSKADVGHHTGGDRSEFRRVELTPDLQKLDANKFTDDLHMRIMSACGIPPALLTAQGNAGAMREAYRLLALQTVQPLARQMLPELTRKLGITSLSIDQMMSADVAGRARAVGSLQKAGVPLDKAMKLVGWEDPV